MNNEYDILLTLGVGAVGILLYYVFYFVDYIRNGHSELFWLHVVIQASFGAYITAGLTLAARIIK